MEDEKINYRANARLARIIIEENSDADDSDVYYYVNKENGALYEHIFQFCQRHLNLTSKNNIGRIGYLYFSNDLKINAWAHPKSIICINYRLIDELIRKYYRRGIFAEVKEMYSYIEFDDNIYNVSGMHINHLMFEYSYEFVYYHELAHLFQYKKKEDLGKNMSINEESTKNQSRNFIFHRHLEELDADILGSFAVSKDLLNVFNLMDSKVKTSENLKKLLSLLISSMFTIFRVLSDSDGSDFYTFECEYPHPFMRAFYISAHILTDLEAKTKIKLTDENTVDTIVNDAVLISNCLFEDKYNFQATDTNIERINEYLANMKASFKTCDYLVINSASEFEI